MERRAQKRLEMSMQVRISGTDMAGEAFEETAEAVDVSRRGLALRTKRVLSPNTTLAIIVRQPWGAKHNGRTAVFLLRPLC